jgi:hypothetical protein
MQKIQVLEMEDRYGLLGVNSWSKVGPHGCPIYWPMTKECFGHGQCSNAVCVCDEGWSGFSPMLPNILGNTDCQNNIVWLVMLRVLALIPAVIVAFISFTRLHVSTALQYWSRIEALSGVDLESTMDDEGVSHLSHSKRDVSEVARGNPVASETATANNTAVDEVKVVVVSETRKDKSESFEIHHGDRRATLDPTMYDGDHDTDVLLNDTTLWQRVKIYLATIVYMPLAIVARTYMKVQLLTFVCSFLNVVTMTSSIAYQQDAMETANRSIVIIVWSAATLVFWYTL